MIPITKPCLSIEEVNYVAETIHSGWVTQGPRVQEFEEKFAAVVEAPYAVAVSSCTTALHLALIAAGIGPGDEVVCPSLSFIATANAIRYVGAEPVFADVDPETYNIDINSATSSLSRRTRAILIVHQMGLPADIDAFLQLCRENQLHLIEDAACAVGSRYKNRPVGSHSDLVCFSFHPRKVITTGDGGMITTHRQDYYERLKKLRQHGMSVNDRARHESKDVVLESYDEIGYNYRLTDIQAAMGIKQLEKLSWIIEQRRKIAETYNRAFVSHPNLKIPFESLESFTNYQSYSLYVKEKASISRNTLMQKLLDKGIGTRRGIMSIHREIPYQSFFNKSLPVTEDLSDRSILLPIYPEMPEDFCREIIDAIWTELVP
jgi:dTDP-4-amino-4,6-dideoxygalactose transaminase